MSTDSTFYAVGGTLAPSAASYITRHSDEELYQALKQGEYCYILTSRQMGKSSLMSKTRGRLTQEGIKTLTLDLSRIGKDSNTITPERWYDGLFVSLAQQLNLYDEFDDFWAENQRLTLLQRWTESLQQLILARFKQPVVIFIDEVDSTQSLPFSTDDFFAGIRECYNRRIEDVEFKRLTFCLLGVATPADLIKDARVTPFNIGRNIFLSDFSLSEIIPLAQGLGREQLVAERLIQRVYHWTGGHPYLTQHVCAALANAQEVQSESGVDNLCHSLFFASRSKEGDHNLGAVSNHVLRGQENCADILTLYKQILAGKKVSDDNTNPLINSLLLSGLLKVKQGDLVVRNNIYKQAFDGQWIDSHMPDAEKRRQEAARRRGFLQAAAIAGGVFAISGGAAFWYWDSYIREIETYCSTYAKRFGIMQCVGKLETPQGRNNSFKFIQTGRRNYIHRVMAVDSSGNCNPRHGVGTYLKQADWNEREKPLRECQWEFVLDANEKIVYEKALSKENKLIWGLVYSPPLDGQTHSTRAHYVGTDGFPKAQTNSQAKFVKFEYSAEGDELARYYVDDNDAPQVGLYKAYGQLQRFDERGLVIESTSIDAHRKLMNDQDGNATQKFIYDEKGNSIEAALFDADGNPVLLNDGYHKWTSQYDERGNEIETAYFGIDGNPVLLNDGYHKRTSQYDERGNEIENAFFGIDGKPVLHKYGYHKRTSQYDARGNAVENAFFGIDGNPVLHKEGFHKWTRQYDAQGNQVEKAYFGIDGNPVLLKDGYHKWTGQYDARGNVVKVVSFDIDGNPILLKDGYHKVTSQYDARGNEVERAYFSIDGNPVLLNDGYHKLTSQHDAWGNQVEIAFFGIDRNPVLSKEGLHKLTRQYDDRGNIVETAFFGIDGKPILLQDGYHKWTSKYDAHGNNVERAYFGIDGNPVLLKDGFHKVSIEYDKQGNEIKTTYFDLDGKEIK